MQRSSLVSASEAAGRGIEIAYLCISSPNWDYGAARLELGKAAVMGRDGLCRFKRSWINFEQHYRLLADAGSMYDHSGNTHILLERSP
jgi:hypothetical protein